MRKPLFLPSAVATTTLLIVLWLTRPLAAASFDCKAAKSSREILVCSNPNLSTLDGALGHAYTALRAALSPPAASAVASDQREWLGWLDQVCSPTAKGYRSATVDCLTSEYTARLRQLTDGHLRADGLVLYPRAHYALVPQKAGEEPSAPNDPGFGTGAFSWPQIDSPNTRFLAWNRAVLAQAIHLSATDAVRFPSTFDSTVEADNEADIFYRLRAINRRLVVVDLGNTTYGYGAAHPNTGINTFSWWFDRERALEPSDIFAPESGWRTKLADRTVARLKARQLLSGPTFTEAEARATIAETLASVTAWTPSSAGFTITFGLYAIAPYAFGMPTVTFSWTELKPYLAPSFDPAELPAPLPRPKP